jgi:hypothetical protein
MKTILTLIMGLLCSVSSLYAQEEGIWKKNKVSPVLVENFEVSKANTKVKNGSYIVFNTNKDEFVRGKFANNVKDSIWVFYSSNGNLIQAYDYSNKKLLYNIADLGSIVKSRYELYDSSLFKQGIVEGPVKIGGIDYAFNLLFDTRNLPYEVKEQKEPVLMEYVFSLNEEGKLEALSLNYSSVFLNVSNPVSIKNLNPDLYEFVPAKVNGKNYKSKLAIQVVLNIAQARDKATYNIPTQRN